MTSTTPIAATARLLPTRGVQLGRGARMPLAAAGLAEHRARYGAVPAIRDARELAAVVDAAGVRGRGGAGFPTARKITAVAAGRRRPIVVVNACESEPASNKDAVLLRGATHLVLDGALIAARALRAPTVVVCLHRGDPVTAQLSAAMAERGGDGVDWRLAEVPRRYVASEASALARFLTDGEARPTARPPRPEQRGVRGRPTLIDNAETLAQLALAVRYGPDWYRAVGTRSDPGTALVTVSGCVARPGVYEIELGAPLSAAIGAAGGPAAPIGGTLVGGYGGTWVRDPGLPLSHDPAGPDGTTIGAGAIVALPADACGVTETARVLRFLAGESAGQCGPCAFGLPAVADDVARLAAGRVDADLAARLTRRLRQVNGRGACAHPTGAVRLARSMLRAFADDLRAHQAGRPCPPRPPVLPIPAPTMMERTWQ
ncbi:NADH-ubiquinone oxidoreductase-F iron-sulfur binding region domain-containing protein [Actinocatenispora thailandica]|nr:NADH-ubiquinone oxidoreductase-F iron-sulfur binding region domain-containing protein [Actinocatenispora thailandica]